MLRLLPLLTGLAPIIAVHGSLLIAINADVLAACNPYLDGCTSISATGRYPPSSFLFKGVMMPESILLAAYWLFSVAWLRALERAAGRDGNGGITIGTLGVAGALFLIVYVTFLGSQGPVYDFMRRFGVYLFFAFTVFAQVMLARRILDLSGTLGRPYLARIGRLKLAIAIVPFGLGILNLALKAILEDADASENIIEWTFALLMQSYFILTYFAWRDTGFGAKFDVAAGR